MSEFSLALNEDQLQIQKWVHDFAESVVRPAAEEWDEKEVERSAALKRIMGWVKLHPYNIAQKVQVVVEHYRNNGYIGVRIGHARGERGGRLASEDGHGRAVVRDDDGPVGARCM